MGHVHLAALKTSEEIALAGIVEPADAARAKLEREGVSLFASPQELIDAGIAEGVFKTNPLMKLKYSFRELSPE